MSVACTGCGQPAEPAHTHEVSDRDARRLGTDPGPYHADCCPYCTEETTVTRP